MPLPLPQTNKKQVRITIPNGVVSGNRMNVNLPNGKQVQVVVPQGMRSGMQMTINYEDNLYAPVVPHIPTHVPQTHKQQKTVQKTVQITIPNGVKPGNQITVNLPNGKSVKITVPNGMKPGNKLTVNCKSCFSTLFVCKESTQLMHCLSVSSCVFLLLFGMGR